MPYIDQRELLEKTNGGLDIIEFYYPSVRDVLTKKTKKFKIREEKTPSASLKYIEKDNVYLCTDFGGDQKPRNGIQVCMLEENLSFGEAIKLLASRYDLKGEKAEIVFKPEISKVDATPEQDEGHFEMDVKEQLTDSELKTLGPYVTQEVCKKYQLFSLNSYTRVKNRKATTISSTEDFPIFVFDYGEFKKIYQPKAPEKQFRFFYVGNKPKNYINGYAQLKKAYAKIQDEYASVEDKEERKKMPQKVARVFLCSGDRDALNVASQGEEVIWLNSETADLTGEQYRKIMNMVEDFFNVPDIDNTGVRAAYALNLKFLDIKTVWLPKQLKEFRDFRGNSCKDVRDFFEKYSKPEKLWKNLVRSAHPLRPYDEVIEKDADGKYKGTKIYFNHLNAYSFLQANGYYQIEDNNDKEGFSFIRIQDQVVRQVRTTEIKGFINDFLKERYFDPKVRNAFYSTRSLSESHLRNLERIELDFKSYTKESQFLFFENKVWEVSKDNIKEYRRGDIERYVWEDEVVPHRVRLQEKPWEITFDEENQLHRVKIKDDSCKFLQFLWHTSRIHWRKEMEQGVQLTEEEQIEQEAHFVNKLYAIGYLLHRYKDPARPWCLFAMDNKIGETGESNGGSGKSTAVKSVRYFMKSVTLEGRNAKLTENPHIYENVNPYTGLVLIDDANQYLKFDFFFSALTGEMTVNPKHGKQYEIPFEDVPKFAITSNFTLRNVDPSTERRLLYLVFSDYFHDNTSGEYKSSHTIFDEFGKNLFLDFNETEWNQFINTMAYALQEYLKWPKIMPPMDNVTRRNLKTQMGDEFKEWADMYFNLESKTLDDYVNKTDAWEAFKSQSGARTKMWSAQRFKKSVQSWASYHGYIFNPQGAVNTDPNRIVHHVNGKAQEFIYISTKGEIKEFNKEEYAFRTAEKPWHEE